MHMHHTGSQEKTPAVEPEDQEGGNQQEVLAQEVLEDEE
jgi:hypothetical protein